MMLYKMHKRWARGGLSWMIFLLLAGSLSAPAQTLDVRPSAPARSSKKITLNYKDSPQVAFRSQGDHHASELYRADRG